jgi:hypothetical protein
MPQVSSSYSLPFPLATDSVDVHGDIKDLVEALVRALPTVSYSQIEVINNTSSVISIGDPVFITGYAATPTGDQATAVARATSSTTQPVLGLSKTQIPIGGLGIVVVSGVLTGAPTSGFSAGDILYAGPSGGLTTAQDHGGAVGVVAFNSSSGVIVVDAKGNGTWGALKAGLA